MITIRKGVFETNSSSSHSIVLMKEDRPNAEIIDPGWKVQNGELDFWLEGDLGFGRSPFDLLTDWYRRLCYAVAYFGDNKDKLKEIEEICRRRIGGFDHFKFQKDHWDNTEYHGYVDHQSYGVLDAALSKYDASLEDFIFNDKFIVVIDGDEYNVFNTLIETGMFNEDAVENITSASYELEEEYIKEREENDV